MQKDLPGPASCEAWTASSRVFKSACLMLNISSSLETYARHVENLILQWPSAWGLVAAADDQAREDVEIEETILTNLWQDRDSGLRLLGGRLVARELPCRGQQVLKSRRRAQAEKSPKPSRTAMYAKAHRKVSQRSSWETSKRVHKCRLRLSPSHQDASCPQASASRQPPP